MTKKEELCRRYLAALNQSDLKGVHSLFAPGAVVISPLYGRVEARKFFSDLFADTNRSDTSLLNIYEPVGTGHSIALHFNYKWTLKSGKDVEFEVVDILEMAENGESFQKLTIIYDTAPIRADFDASRQSTPPR